MFIPAITFSQDLSTYDLTVEHKTNPVGMDILHPRLSWKIKGTGNNVMQTVYWIRVATDPKFPGSKIVWQSGEVASDESVLIPYKGPDLKPGQRYYWQVKVWDNKGRTSKWSRNCILGNRICLHRKTGKQNGSKWKATQTVILLHLISGKNSLLKKILPELVVYVTSHGFYELHLNGKKVGDQVLTPGWTSYGKRIQYQVYDVTTSGCQRVKMRLVQCLATDGTAEHSPGEITGQFTVKGLDF